METTVRSLSDNREDALAYATLGYVSGTFRSRPIFNRKLEEAENQRQLVEDEYVSWVSHLLPIEQAITEHEALKKDVARYFELESRIKEYNFVTLEDKQEYFRLHSKLSKVGKEE